MITIELAKKLIATQFPEYTNLPVDEIEEQGHIECPIIHSDGTPCGMRFRSLRAMTCHVRKSKRDNHGLF